MKFRFRLQAVYDLRQHEEDEQKDAFAREQRRLAELEARERALRDEAAAWSRRYLEKMAAGVLPQEAARITGYLEELARRTEQAARLTAQQAVKAEGERKKLVVCMQERKTLENLYGRQFERFVYNERHETEKEIEEMIASRRG